MPLVVQNVAKPTEILLSLNALASPGLTRFRAAVAYVTVDGCLTLYREMEQRITEWRRIAKVLVTSFDFGLTDPSALEKTLAIPNFQVLIANLVPHPDGSYAPSGRTNFHPKLYIFDRGPARDLFVGSANLSGRALDVNTEAGFLARDADPAEVETLWQLALRETIPLTPQLLAAYGAQRRRIAPPFDPSPPLIVTPMPPPTRLDTLAAAMADGRIDPSVLDAFWVEAGSMSSGGSRSQLELPRGGHRFFTHTFTRYASTAVTPIGLVDLIARGLSFVGQPLRWHGDNRMERLNLPTQTQGGYAYPGTAVLFRRRGAQFEMEVAPWDSAKAISWRNASARANSVFRLGERTTRICGFF